MAKILVVDDEQSIRSTFEIFLSKEGHEVFLADEVGKAKKTAAEQKLDLIITDIIMPKATGIELLGEFNSKEDNIPIIVMTGEPTLETAKEAVRYNANDYLIKPVSKDTLLKAVRYALNEKRLVDKKLQLEIENEKYRNNLEKLVHDRTQALQKAVNGTIETIVQILQHKDPYTVGHVRRVGALSLAIAEKLNMDDEKKKCIYFAGYLHDIGKLYIASEILSKPGKLSEGEFAVVKEHVSNGYELTKNIELPWPVADIIMQHHERLDGSGYPKGLKGDEIGIEARILAIADVIEAMTSHRPYRPGFGLNIALDEIKNNMGVLYDRKAAAAAVELFEKDNYDLSTALGSMLL